jgi:hypothetical protein
MQMQTFLGTIQLKYQPTANIGGHFEGRLIFELDCTLGNLMSNKMVLYIDVLHTGGIERFSG